MPTSQDPTRSEPKHEGAGGTKPILVLRKARLVLDCFSQEQPRLSFQELRRATGLPASTCLRVLHSLVREGFLDRHGDLYRPGHSLLYWASLVPAGSDLLTAAGPILSVLRDDTGESSCLYVRDGHYRTCVAQQQSRHPIIRQLPIGKVMPLSAGSAGKVFLAFDEDLADEVLSGELVPYTPHTIIDPDRLRLDLKRVRSDYVATSSGERDQGAASMSAPVFNAQGLVIAAVGIAGPVQRFEPGALDEWAPAVRRAAAELSTVMGHRARREGSSWETATGK